MAAVHVAQAAGRRHRSTLFKKGKNANSPEDSGRFHLDEVPENVPGPSLGSTAWGPSQDPEGSGNLELIVAHAQSHEKQPAIGTN